MDRERFDTLARFVGTKQSRRAAVTALLGAALAGHAAATLSAERNRPRRGKGKGRAQAAAAASACYPGTRCVPSRGANASRCDFSRSTLFRNRNVRGANLSNSHFFDADLRGADFRGANLGGSCFIDADLTGAKLGSSVNLGGAVFCNTTMPNGTVDNSGCERETACCNRLGVADCPDARVLCFNSDENGICTTFQGFLGPYGNCWSFGFGCCPCGQPPQQDHWAGQCNNAFPGCQGNCVAGNELPFFCLSLRNCSTNHSEITA